MSVPHLNQLINVQMTGNRRIAAQIRQMNQNFERLGRTVDRMSNQIQRSMTRQRRATQRTTQQTRTGLTNIQSGLVQLSTWLLNVNVKINNVFANMKTRFTEAETAMTQLKITMGLSGKTAVDSSVDFQRFAEASSQIDLLARTTQFTKREVANAFTALVQSGRTVDEASKMISSTLQFATASGGMLNLTDSVDLATLTIGTLGGAVDEVDGNLNMLLKTSQKTKIGFTDLRQVLQSMRSAYTKFSEVGGVSREAELMATAAALRTLGLSAGNSGQVIDQFSRSMDTMYSALNKVFMMEDQPNRKGRRRPRFSYKRGALAELFGVGRFSVQELQKELNTTETDLRKLQDRFLMAQIFEYDKTGTRGSRRSLSDFITRLLKGYSEVVRRRGEGPADSLIKNALGTAGASTLIKSIISLAKTAGKSIDEAAEHYIGLVKELQTNSKEMLKADEEAKQTIAYRTKVLDSAIAALSNTIFEQDLVAISALDTYKEMVSATDTLMRNNKGLASSVGMLGRGMQLLTGIGTNVGFALVAAATFSTALNVATAATGATVTGLSATLGAFSRMFLLPTLVVVGQFTLALGGLSLAVVALINYFSDGMGVAKGFKVMLDNIKYSAQGAGGMINSVFSDRLKTPIKSMISDLDALDEELAGIRSIGAGEILDTHSLDQVTKEIRPILANLKSLSHYGFLPEDMRSKVSDYLKLREQLEGINIELGRTNAHKPAYLLALGFTKEAIKDRMTDLRSELVDYDPTTNMVHLVKSYYKSIDRMSELERRIFNAKASGLQGDAISSLVKEYNALSESISMMKGVFGEAGYVGLDALDARGARDLAFTFANLIQLAKDLVSALKVVAEGAVVPLTYAMDFLMGILYTASSVVLAPFRLLAYLLGQASDQASVAAKALKLFGYILGGLLAFRMLSFFFGMFMRGVQGIVGGFTRAGAAVSQYVTRTQTLLNNAAQQINLNNSRNAGSLARLELLYIALTGSVERYGAAHIRLAQGTSLSAQALERQAQRLQTARARMVAFARSATGAVMAIGGVAASIGALMSMGLFGEQNAQLGHSIMMYSMLATTAISAVTAMVPVITSAFAIMTGSVLGFLAVLGPLLLVFAGAYMLYNYLTDTKTKGGSSSSVGITPTYTGGTASFGGGVTPETSGFGGPTMGAAPFERTTVASTNRTVNDYSNQTNVSIDQAVFELRGGRPEDLKETIRSISKRVSGGTSFATDMG